MTKISNLLGGGHCTENKHPSDTHFLIEGDNLHSLKLLEKTHRNAVDIIYIDPPYNTGNKEDKDFFRYNDEFIDKNDGFRHSKWLSFMHKRLKIAKNLLNSNGFIFISIDDNEFAQLKLLCDEIFNEENYVNEIIWQKLTASKAQSQYLSKLHEKVLVYRKSSRAELNKLYEPSSEDDKTYKHIEAHTGRRYGSFDFTQKGQGEGKWFGEQFLEPPQGKHWIWSQEKINEGLAQGLILFTKNGTPRVKRYLDNKKGNLIGDIWINNGVSPLSSNASERVGFYTQKPLSLMKRILSMVHPNALVLDFFAGSGTTGHAVVQLNKEDGGNRRYILCTSNENDICEEVTYPRLKNIQGELPHNLKYFKTAFIPRLSNETSLTMQLRQCVQPLIELQWGIAIDNKRLILIQDEDDLANKLTEQTACGATLFVSPYLFFSAAQQVLIAEKKLHVIDIPTYYFRQELIQGGEL